jgi:hypothetical protein
MSWYPSWTTCCKAGSWYQLPIPLAGVLAGISAGVTGGIVGALAAALLPGVAAGLAAAFLVGVFYCTWWLNVRLICLSPTAPGDRGVLGVIYNTEPPEPTLGFWNLGAYDNDYSFNLLVHPAVPRDMLPNWYAKKFFPAQPWDPNATPTLQTEWAGRFPTFPFENANLFLPQQQAMGSLGLGFTGQYVEYTGNLGNPSQLPLMSVSVLPAAISVHAGHTAQFTATGLRADGTAENLTQGTDAVTWSSSGPSATIDDGGLATADATHVGTVEISAVAQNGVSGSAQMTTLAKNPPYQQGRFEQFLIHCEIEGGGMNNLRTLLISLGAACAVASIASLFPPFGTAIAAILLLLMLLALLFGGPAIQGNGGGNPPGGAPASSPGYPYVDAPSPGSMVNIVYVYGRWVFDSLHQPSGSNELHPVHFVNQVVQVPQIDITTGNWPSTVVDTKAKYDAAYSAINQPSTVAAQSLPQNQWVLHPLLDGCLAGSGYPAPPPPPAPPAPK